MNPNNILIINLRIYSNFKFYILGCQTWKILWKFPTASNKYVHAKTVTANGRPDPREAEAWAFLQALKWIPQLDLANAVIEFESDCKAVVDVLHSSFNGVSEFYSILANCKNHLSLYPNSRMSLIRGQANQDAHIVARVSRFYASHHVFEHIFNFIFALIMNEMQ